tara:strand:- start:1399 stop:1581 length:183 start_codon:yes stop_codon:yes gene_type:complete
MITTEDGGRQNMYAKEPPIEVIDQDYVKQAETVNGQLAMVGWMAMLGAYLTTGQIIPGVL